MLQHLRAAICHMCGIRGTGETQSKEYRAQSSVLGVLDAETSCAIRGARGGNIGHRSPPGSRGERGGAGCAPGGPTWPLGRWVRWPVAPRPAPGLAPLALLCAGGCYQLPVPAAGRELRPRVPSAAAGPASQGRATVLCFLCSGGRGKDSFLLKILLQEQIQKSCPYGHYREVLEEAQRSAGT
jgi:hypothetical protein